MKRLLTQEDLHFQPTIEISACMETAARKAARTSSAEFQGRRGNTMDGRQWNGENRKLGKKGCMSG